MPNPDRIRLALSILSGRVTELDYSQYDLLGYDSYKFGYYGKPSLDELKGKAEEIILYALIEKGKTDDRSGND